MGTPPTIEFASLGMADSLILMVMALVVFGPRRLPQIGRQIGKLMYEFRKASNDFKYQMEEELRSAEEAERRKKEEERLRALASAAPTLPAAAFDAPAMPVAASAPSPYPEEVAYPEVTAAAPEAKAEETYPRIQPPSTGEPVPAARPNSPAAPAELQPDEATQISAATDPGPTVEADTGVDPAPEAVPAGADPAFESSPQAAHHG